MNMFKPFTYITLTNACTFFDNRCNVVLYLALKILYILQTFKRHVNQHINPDKRGMFLYEISLVKYSCN